MTSSILEKAYDQSQFWREEMVDGATYITYLKKIPLQMRPWAWTENATHTLWETERIRCISAGTLPKLVEALATKSGQLDEDYANMFFYMFRTFASVEEVLNLILDRIKYWKYNEKRNRPQATVYKTSYIIILLMWMKMYPEDFQQTPDYSNLKRLISLADEYTGDSDVRPTAEKLLRRFEAAGVKASLVDAVNVMPTSSSPEKIECNATFFLSLKPSMIAEQLTYKDVEVFTKVVPLQCLGCYRGGEGEVSDVSTVLAVVSHYNDVSNLVITSVLDADPQSKHRAKVMEHWIMVAQNLRKMNSFSSLHAVVTSLMSSVICGLEQSLTAVGKKATAEYKEITRMLALDNNAFNSREVLMQEATSRCFTNSRGELVRKYPKQVTMQGTIPLLDLFLSNLSSLDSAIPSKTATGLINFEKRRQEYEILTQLMLLQKSATLYKFKRAPVFWKWFHSVSENAKA